METGRVVLMMEVSRHHNRRRILMAVVFVMALVVLIRVAIRYFYPPAALSIIIFDKTVPDRSFREHKALINVLGADYLNALTGDYFDVERDYSGFVPLPNDTYMIRSLPPRFDGVDLFYLTDAYGVYTQEFYGRNMKGERSTKIYGGLSLSDISAIQRARSAGAFFIAEFNTFGSPTADPARDAVAEILGVHWTGWIGRYFTNLVRAGEVPSWAIANYERQTGTHWAFTGPGYLLFRDDSIIVLTEGGNEDIGKDGCTFARTEAGARLFPEIREEAYQYWFDIVEPDSSAMVLAEFTLHVTPQGAVKLSHAGIPASFPAITLHEVPAGSSLYFSGDFADRDDRFVFLRSNRESIFHDNVYKPLMRSILKRIAGHRGQPGSLRLMTVPGPVAEENTDSDQPISSPTKTASQRPRRP